MYIFKFCLLFKCWEAFYSNPNPFEVRILRLEREGGPGIPYSVGCSLRVPRMCWRKTFRWVESVARVSCVSPAEKGEFSALPPWGDNTRFDLLHLFKVETRPLYVVRPWCAPMPLVGTSMAVALISMAVALMLKTWRLPLSTLHLLSQLVFPALAGQWREFNETRVAHPSSSGPWPEGTGGPSRTLSRSHRVQRILTRNAWAAVHWHVKKLWWRTLGLPWLVHIKWWGSAKLNRSVRSTLCSLK